MVLSFASLPDTQFRPQRDRLRGHSLWLFQMTVIPLPVFCVLCLVCLVAVEVREFPCISR